MSDKFNYSGDLTLGRLFTRLKTTLSGYAKQSEVDSLSEAIDNQQKDLEEVQESVENIEYQDITTGLAYSHEGLPAGEKTVSVQSDGVFGGNCYAYAGEDLVPRKTFNRKFPYNGITITRNGMTYHVEGTATATTRVVFMPNATDTTNPIDDSLVGKKLKITTFSNAIIGSSSMYVSIMFKDADDKTVPIVRPNGTTSTTEAAYVGKSASMHSASCTVPTGASSITVQLELPTNMELNFDFQIYVTAEELTSAVSIAEPTNVANAYDSNDILTFPYQSTVAVKAPIDDYIKYMARNAEGDKATYLMPETFGAVGDGYADDSEAISLCIATASETKQAVLMAQKYSVSTPIVISSDGLNIIANDIVYTGSDTAVKISGQKNTIKVHSIKSSGVGISYRGDNNKFVCHNDVEVNNITSTSHGIVLYNGLKGIYQNTIRFNSIIAGGNNTYGICMLDAEGSAWVNENNFFGGQIANCDWAVYRIRGNSKLYNIQVEDNVAGGFYIIGDVIIFYPRLAESARDGSFPYFKFLRSKHTHIYPGTPISINEIDLTECEETETTSTGNTHAITENAFGTIYGSIMAAPAAVGEDRQTPYLFADKAYVWGKRLILTTRMDYRKVVTTDTLDTRSIHLPEYQEGYNAITQLPTKFVVNTVNTQIYLHESYCAFGFNKFEVEQANGCACQIYNYDKNLIFDGTEYGDGTYKITCYKDSELANNNGGLMWIPGHGSQWRINQTWDVMRIGMPLVSSQQ